MTIGKIVLIIFIIVILFPMWVMIKTSFEAYADAIALPPHLIPDWSLKSYKEILWFPVGTWFINSVVISIGAVIGTCLICLAAAYGFEKHTFRFKEAIFWTLLATVTVPGTVTLIPRFLMLQNLGLLDMRFGVILPTLAPILVIFFLRIYLRGLPDSFLESAAMEGSSELRTFFSCLVPLTKPALATVSILTFLSTWKSYLWQLVVLRSTEKKTLVVGMAEVLWYLARQETRGPVGNWRDFGVNYGAVCAGAVIVFIPLLLMFLAFQKHFIKSIYAGGLS